MKTTPRHWFWASFSVSVTQSFKKQCNPFRLICTPTRQPLVAITIRKWPWCSLSACSDVCQSPSAWVAHALLWSHLAWAYFAHTFTRTARGNKRRLIQSDRRDGRALFPFFSLSAGSFLSQLLDILIYWVLTLSVLRWKRLKLQGDVLYMDVTS